MRFKKSFKDHVRSFYNKWMASDDVALIPSGCLKQASPSVVARWIADTWADRPEAMVALHLRNAAF